MIKIAINTKSLAGGHGQRGVGYYTVNLINALEKIPEVNLVKFKDFPTLRKVDVVHFPWFDLFFHNLPLWSKFPLVVTIHDVIPLVFSKNYPRGLRGKINYQLQRLSLKNCRFVITDSEKSKSDIKKLLNIAEDKIKVVYLAADPQFKVISDESRLLRLKKKYRLPDHFVLYVGDANYSKNLPFLIEGFKALKEKKQFSDLGLVLVGGVFLKNVENIDHPELTSLKETNQLIKEYRLEGEILRPGRVSDEDLVTFYNLATVYVQPSLYEGFGLPVLQAFSCGTPVLCSNAGSLLEVGGKAAVYFDPCRLDQFTALMEEVLINRSLRQKLSDLGLEQAKKFSWKKTARDTLNVYYQAISKA